MRKSGLAELEVVLAVARKRGFVAAAVELEISTTAVSSAVAKLDRVWVPGFSPRDTQRLTH